MSLKLFLLLNICILKILFTESNIFYKNFFNFIIFQKKFSLKPENVLIDQDGYIKITGIFYFLAIKNLNF